MKGQTLIEVLVALASAVFVITAITILGISSLNNAQFIKDQGQASQYAEDGMEFMRGLRDSDYVGFKNYSGNYCFAKGQTILGSAQGACSTPNIDNRYIRSINVQQNIPLVNGGCGPNLALVNVSVAWIDSKCGSGIYCHSSKISSCFSTVQPVLAP